MATAQPNHRASLLAGLRTGGVRSSSVPHTAALGGSFNPPRFASHHSQAIAEDVDEFFDGNEIYIPTRANQGPMTAAVDGRKFMYQQSPTSQPLNGSLPFSPGLGVATNAQAQAIQIQLMQLEMMRLQAIQVQQYQAELLAQSQQQQQQSQNWRTASNPPASAGPQNLRFAAAMNNQLRGNQADQLRSRLGVSQSNEPMTAALNGKFGSRMAIEEEESSEVNVPPPTPSRTTVISGGTVIGSPMSNNIHSGAPTVSKSDSATSWRRNGKNNSVLSGNRAVTLGNPPPSVKITPPPGERTPSPPNNGTHKSRPQPLQFSIAASQSLPAIAIDSSEVDGDDSSSSTSSRSGGSPTTPSSNDIHMPPLSPREEATKKLYEGLGIGRPVPSVVITVQPPASSLRVTSQPSRQPRGPPSGADELGPKNFATRIRRKAIGGLNVLLESRERRDVEVC